jgi:hypothetical protein
MIKKEKTCLLINIAIPDISNFNANETGKLSTETWRLNSGGCGM